MPQHVPVPIIVLAGQAGAGKDTAAAYLQKTYGAAVVGFADPFKRFLQQVFEGPSDKLWGSTEQREVLCRYLPSECAKIRENYDYWNEDFLRYSAGHPHAHRRLDEWFEATMRDCPLGVAPREMLQKLGSDWGRAIDPNIWVNVALRTSEGCLAQEFSYDRLAGQFDIKSPYEYAVITDGRFRNEILAVKKAGGVAIKVVRKSAGARVGFSHESETELTTVPNHWFGAVLDNSGPIGRMYWNLDVIMQCVFGDYRRGPET